jgi:hypothetical protein
LAIQIGDRFFLSHSLFVIHKKLNSKRSLVFFSDVFFSYFLFKQSREEEEEEKGFNAEGFV